MTTTQRRFCFLVPSILRDNSSRVQATSLGICSHHHGYFVDIPVHISAIINQSTGTASKLWPNKCIFFFSGKWSSSGVDVFDRHMSNCPSPYGAWPAGCMLAWPHSSPKQLPTRWLIIVNRATTMDYHHPQIIMDYWIISWWNKRILMDYHHPWGSLKILVFVWTMAPPWRSFRTPGTRRRDSSSWWES